MPSRQGLADMIQMPPQADNPTPLSVVGVPSEPVAHPQPAQAEAESAALPTAVQHFRIHSRHGHAPADSHVPSVEGHAFHQE